MVRIGVNPFQVRPGNELRQSLRERVEATIFQLRLNDRTCRNLRETYACDYWAGDISFNYLSRRAPFIALELERQGRLRTS